MIVIVSKTNVASHDLDLVIGSAIDAFLAKFGLRTSIIWGQGYDGASNMQREFNVQNALSNSEICSERGLNQKTTFIRPGNTRSGSHYGITNELSEALQRKDQDIVNAILLVRILKERLQKLREDGWASLFSEVSSFCQKHGNDVPNMNDDFVAKRKVTEESSQGN
ncbi:hypothetical protein J1N35_029871 [Gossypium stocksii]|uniref:Uncharacterized protein n=1 Tax=Gossypium stocksii TaxID=47602 RepID=A0A9D3ZU69_9ROSI|nr:hypothetical protein J1N35_029871 [Gossypium stocksii]